MAASQRDLSLSVVDDASQEERNEAFSAISRMVSASGRIPEWVKNPPEWWITMYLLHPVGSKLFEEIAFERIESRPGWYKALHPLMFHHMMIIGRVDDEVGYEDRWCFANFECALEAFTTWDGAEGTEPDGWHKHPPSGRTRMKLEDGTWFDTTGKIQGKDY